MKQKILSIATALALCLSLLPSWALADGVVSFTASDVPTALDDGKRYPESADNSCIELNGNLTQPVDPDTENDNGTLNPAARSGNLFKGTTDITAMGSAPLVTAASISYDGEAVSITDLALNGCGLVSISADSPIEDAESEVSCNQPVLLYQNVDDSDDADQILETEDITWANGGEVPAGILKAQVPTRYTAGDGYVYFTSPAEAGGTGTLTLENASADFFYVPCNVDLELKGTNSMKNLNAYDHNYNTDGSNYDDNRDGIKTITGDGTFSGALTTKKPPESISATLNAFVCTKEKGTEGNIVDHVTVYGTVINSIYLFSSVDSTSLLTITEGSTLMTIDDNLYTSALSIPNIDALENKGTIVNNGIVNLYDIGDNFSQVIKDLNLESSGTVQVWKDEGVYGSCTNSGVAKRNNLNLAKESTYSEGLGYKYEENGDGSHTLTLTNIEISDTLTLPSGVDVTVVTNGACKVGTLAFADSPQPMVTFSGDGTLTIENRVEATGTPGQYLTVEQRATVKALGGIAMGESGIGSTVTVNGTLEVTGTDNYAALYVGNLAIGSTGKLAVSGSNGVYIKNLS